MGFQVPTIQNRSGSIKFGTLYYDLARKPSNDPNHPCEIMGLLSAPSRFPKISMWPPPPSAGSAVSPPIPTASWRLGPGCPSQENLYPGRLLDAWFVLVVENRNLFELAWRPDCRRCGRMRALLFAGARRPYGQRRVAAQPKIESESPLKPIGLLLWLPG